MTADHDEVVGFDDGLALAVDEGAGGEVVDVVDGAHHAHRGAGVPDPGGGARRDAVLGVQDVELARERAETCFERVDGGEHAFLEGGERGRCVDERHRRGDRPEESALGIAEGDDSHVHAAAHHGLGERERMNDAAAWFGRVAHERDPRHGLP